MKQALQGPPEGGRSSRIDAVDWLRGIVMVLMALDHCRDYFGDFRVNPVDLATTTPALFFTRWVTHFCAPVFVFLAGTAAWLYGARGRSKAELARFLWTRGLWLLVLEFTVVYFAWTTSFTVGIYFVQVIAAIGFAMIVLAGLVFLSLRAIAIVGFVIVAGHNLLDGITPEDWGAGAWIWRLLHEGSMQDGVFLPMGSLGLLMVVYPLLPWVGVMALGYAFGPLTRGEPEDRRRRFLRLGLALIAAFVLLRAVDVYGDAPWEKQATLTNTVLAFVNCTKYPPSLAFLLMTLGPAILSLAFLDRVPGSLGRVFITFGRVPLFYYVTHILLINLSSRLLYRLVYGQDFAAVGDGMKAFMGGPPFPDWYGHGLWLVYLSWILIVVALYPACAWFAGVKRRSRAPWMSYL